MTCARLPTACRPSRVLSPHWCPAWCSWLALRSEETLIRLSTFLPPHMFHTLRKPLEFATSNHNRCVPWQQVELERRLGLWGWSLTQAADYLCKKEIGRSAPVHSGTCTTSCFLHLWARGHATLSALSPHLSLPWPRNVFLIWPYSLPFSISRPLGGRGRHNTILPQSPSISSPPCLLIPNRPTRPHTLPQC